MTACRLARAVPLKVISALRKILSRSSKHSRGESKKLIFEALKKGDVTLRVAALKSIDYTLMGEMSMESKKTVAFQLAQTLALIRGIFAEEFSFFRCRNLFEVWSE